MFAGLDLYWTDPTQELFTAGYAPEDVDRSLSRGAAFLYALRTGPTFFFFFCDKALLGI